MLSEKAFEECWELLEATFGEQPPARKDAYWTLMKDDFTDAGFRQSCVRHCKNGSAFFPKPAELYTRGSDPKIRALQAWKLYLDDHHPGETKVYEDQIIHAVVTSLGGPQQVSDGIRSPDEFTYQQLGRDFQKLHETFTAHPPPNIPDRLIGNYELNNRERWPEHVPAPKLIACDYLPEHEKQLAAAKFAKLLADRKLLTTKEPVK